MHSAQAEAHSSHPGQSQSAEPFQAVARSSHGTHATLSLRHCAWWNAARRSHRADTLLQQRLLVQSAQVAEQPAPLPFWWLRQTARCREVTEMTTSIIRSDVCDQEKGARNRIIEPQMAPFW